MGMELEYIKVYPASNPGWNGWMGWLGLLGRMGWHALFYVPIYTPKCPLMGPTAYNVDYDNWDCFIILY